MPNSPSGLRRKIWAAFLLQAASIAFAALLGVYGASAVLKHVLIQRVLQEEAAHYWQRLKADPGVPTPDTYNLSGHLLGPGGDAATLPAPLQGLAPGFHSLPREQGGSLVLVQRDAEGRTLYMVFKQQQLDRLAFWFGMAPLALLLVVIYIVAWNTYRSSRRAVSPVIWLAGQVQRWDPKNPEASALRPENLPRDVEGETLVLASSLHDFANRIASFVEREHDFTRDASHELRTPLTVIRVAGDMMDADQSLTPLSRRALGRIRGAGRDMEALIESFLILAREGDIGLPDDDFAVSEVVAEEVEKARLLLKGKPVTLELVQEADFRLHAPARVLTVLLSNLLRNACHYTDEGRITVTVRRGSITIADTGVGMNADELSLVFKPFYRRGDRDVGGHGIGLSIVERLSQRYGWPLQLSSEPGRGTIATLGFPNLPPDA